MQGKTAVFSTGALVFLLTVPGCSEPPAATPPPPPEVVVETATQQDTTVFLDFTGNLQAVEAVEIRARVKGFLETFEFTPAQFVDKGDLLFTIEREQYAAAKAQAEADLKASEAYLRRTESDLERLEQAVKTNAVSQQEVSRATAERDQARASLLAAEAKLDRATIDLEYTEIRAPIDGLISRQLVDPGNLVGHNEPTLLARMYKIDPIHVYFEIDEETVLRILDQLGGMQGKGNSEAPDGPPVQVTVAGLERVFEGKADYLEPSADAETGTVQVRAVLPNKDGLLLPGVFANIRVPGRELPGALLVPETALSTDLGGRYLMLVNGEGNAEKRYVTPGPLQEDNMRVVFEGLEPDERFIVKGLQRARPGAPVRVASN